MKPTLVIFDLDGTLFFTEAAFIPAMKNFFDEYKKPVPPAHELMALVGEPESKMKEWLESLQLSDKYDVLRRKMIEYECAANIEHGKLFEGVLPLLEWLNEKLYTVCLCTNAHNDYLNSILDPMDIRKYFKYIHNPQGKRDTKISMTRQIIKESGKKDGFFVGDRHHDIEAGKANRLTTVGCTFGYGKEEVQEADILIDFPYQLMEYLQLQ